LFLFQLLAVSLPFSVEINILADHKVYAPSELLLILIAGTMLLDLILNPGSLKRYHPKGLWLILPLIISLFFSSLFSELKLVSVKFTFIYLLYLFTFFIGLQQLLKEAPWLFHKLVSLYSTGFILIACLAFYRYANYGFNPVVVKGLFEPFYADHTIFGATAAILAAYWFTQPRIRKNQNVWLAKLIGIVFILIVFLSYSRAAILSVIVFLFFYVLLLVKTKIWQVLAMFAIVVLVVAMNSQSIFNIMKLNNNDSGYQEADLIEHTLSSANITTDVSNEERLNRWDAGLRMAVKKPLQGFGPGTFQFTYIPFQRPEMMTRLSVKDPYHIPDNSGGTAHSEYILALSEMGVPGFLAWILIPMTLLFMAFKIDINQRKRKFVIVGFVALSSYFFHAFFNNFLNTDKFAFLFWGLTAWVCFNYYNTSQKDEV
jgi:O-antigen ligase